LTTIIGDSNIAPTQGDLPNRTTKRPYIIERPLPIDRFINLHYNKTVVEEEYKPPPQLMNLDLNEPEDFKEALLTMSNEKRKPQKPPVSSRKVRTFTAASTGRHSNLMFVAKKEAINQPLDQ
jgi:hypothetical protein